MRTTEQYELDCVKCGTHLESPIPEMKCPGCGALIAVEWQAEVTPTKPRNQPTISDRYDNGDK